MLSFKEKLTKNYINARGWRSNRKLLLIESDDWGSIRISSREVYEMLLDSGIPVDKFHFDKFDSLESTEDLEALFQTLEKFQDFNGNHPVLTAYHLVANPNFDKIEVSGRKEYHYETVLETYSRFKHTEGVFQLIREGIDKGIYIPQSHGREHIHVKRWMEAINSDSEKEQIAFENRAIISSKSSSCNKPYAKNYFAGQDYSSVDEFSEIESIHADGLKLFEEIFGYKSLSFTSQGSFWGDHLLETFSKNGVRLIGGRQFHPVIGSQHKFVNRYWGQKNQWGQLHWRRNCMFEPARNQNFDWVSKCLQEIEVAFRWGKPAVISSHRENFIGTIFDSNREQSLKKLSVLLVEVQKKWPKTEFISTHRLGELMLPSEVE
ncbi:hypothetical protein [Lewinella sp. LCG006]|uniref:hypothetical protein n=1 Tax=Lewinella sp. LCG006 TaxID=3231911 RepID=UPI003460ED45